MRLVIGGAPRSGKSHLGLALSAESGTPVLHTDDLIALGWGADSEAAALWFDLPAFIVEGVASVRALRKWMAAHPGKPCDRLIWLDEPREPLTPGQAAMAKGTRTMLDGIRAELIARAVEIV